MNKYEVKENMQKAYMLLLDCDVAIAELNDEDHQFDYCTDSALADITDKLSNRIENISRKVYQE